MWVKDKEIIVIYGIPMLLSYLERSSVGGRLLPPGMLGMGRANPPGHLIAPLLPIDVFKWLARHDRLATHSLLFNIYYSTDLFFSSV